KGFSEQEGGTHADEVETSMMLYIDPSSVDMSKAVKDYTPSTGTGLLNRRPGGTGTYSRTGIWGDPTRATREKDGSLSKRWLRESSTTSPLCDRPGCRLARPPQAPQRNPRARLWRPRPPIQHQTVPTAARLETNAR
ncbi:MAG: creatininase family protein, partial [Burkholderiales bacterium]